MSSPFPGMDPYLEGYLWPDVNSALASKIRQHLTPKMRSRYVARLEINVIKDNAPQSEFGIMYPEVEVMQVRQNASLTIPVLQPIPVRVVTVEIRDTEDNILVTSIEIISPVNKREPGLTAYRQKRQRIYKAGVHLIELDLLRRGTRPFSHPRLPDVSYAIALTRAQSGVTDIWPLKMQDTLPIIPVPLGPPDRDVVL